MFFPTVVATATAEQPLLDSGRIAALWLIAGFTITFAVTRWVTVKIRRREVAGTPTEGGAIKNVHIGGVHVHHQVWGILLVLMTGVLSFRYRPDSPWLEILAVLFGAGTALALDEFALWLHLEDVYWSEEGRKSIDAVLVALVVGTVLILGSSPLGVDSTDLNEQGWTTFVIIVATHILTVVLCLLKGKLLMGLSGLLIPGVALVGTLRLARPESFWARRFYKGRKRERANERGQRVQARRDRLRDRLAGSGLTSTSDKKRSAT
ncbi:hypothetical protein ON058_09390 [Demequina sp. B12]|uniref:hypothetical protein n=1 Tax=Demequina sp. B12 TaxID=2992757 RepID=UPI00237C2C6A|nr:hypothetical protein [Demequina sp. B12]MDE0573625.1 hypothetical protein [Demequina sp. B12]